ncbi:hypothetical protein V0R37_09765 [Pollutimonas sp. H1-120]|uniref:hypothetical protein n=1 Tax=Pollutimonas sp. H1-120 TaxID=3148824 RepID=UPI003B52D8BE
MKQDTHDREKQLAALRHNQRQAQARDDLQATKDQDFYARLGLSGPDSSTPEDAYVISIHCERWDLPDLEAGVTSTRDIELDRVTLDADDPVRHSRDYGISEPSSTDPSMTPNI